MDLLMFFCTPSDLHLVLEIVYIFSSLKTHKSIKVLYCILNLKLFRKFEGYKLAILRKKKVKISPNTLKGKPVKNHFCSQFLVWRKTLLGHFLTTLKKIFILKIIYYK